MLDRYIVPHTEDGLGILFDLTVSLRRVGFRTRMGETKVGHSQELVYALVAVPKVRPNRKERGCELRKD